MLSLARELYFNQASAEKLLIAKIYVEAQDGAECFETKFHWPTAPHHCVDLGAVEDQRFVEFRCGFLTARRVLVFQRVTNVI